MFSYVITHRSSTDDRKRNLDYLITYINNNFQDIDIIVVEQDSEERYFNSNCRKEFICDGGLFSRSKCLNAGYSVAKYDRILFADNDLLIPRESVIMALSLLSKYDAVNPYKKVYDMSESSTVNMIKYDNFSHITNYSTRHATNFSGGACFFTKEGYAKIGGYDEEFIGWGGEDDACTIKIEKLLKHIELDGHCWHMYHDRAQSNELHPHYSNNVSYLNMIINLGNEDISKLCADKRSIHGW